MSARPMHARTDDAATAERRALMDWANGPGGCTLDGAAAVVCGALMPFAHVRQIGERGRDCEYAWETVAHVLASGGAFRS